MNGDGLSFSPLPRAGRNLGKTNPLNDEDLAEFVKLQKTIADSPKSWSVDVDGIDKETFDLSVKNPNGGEEIKHRSPKEIMDEIAELDAESAEVLGRIMMPLSREERAALRELADAHKMEPNACLSSVSALM